MAPRSAVTVRDQRSGRPATPGPAYVVYIPGIHRPRGPMERREAPMSVKQALLALLEQGPMYGYQLRAEFEQRTGSTWPLNVGQVYTTLTRLERDGLVEGDGADDEGHVDLPRHRRRARGEVVARGSPPRWPAPSRRATSWRSSSRWPSPCPASTSARVIQQQRSATMTRAAGLHPAQAQPAAAARPTTRPSWPGAWSSTPWSSPPRPRSAGSTTARRGCAGRPPAPPRTLPQAQGQRRVVHHAAAHRRPLHRHSEARR